MTKFVFLFLLACAGCRSPLVHQGDVDSARACALLHVLQDTTELARLSESCGALFFSGVREETLNLLRPFVDKNLRLELGTANLKREPSFIDTISGKEGMLVTIETTHKSTGQYFFRVWKIFGTLGAADYYVEVELLEGKWQVTKFEHGGHTKASESVVHISLCSSSPARHLRLG